MCIRFELLISGQRLGATCTQRSRINNFILVARSCAVTMHFLQWRAHTHTHHWNRRNTEQTLHWRWRLTDAGCHRCLSLPMSKDVIVLRDGQALTRAHKQKTNTPFLFYFIFFVAVAVRFARRIFESIDVRCLESSTFCNWLAANKIFSVFSLLLFFFYLYTK